MNKRQYQQNFLVDTSSIKNNSTLGTHIHLAFECIYKARIQLELPCKHTSGTGPYQNPRSIIILLGAAIEHIKKAEEESTPEALDVIQQVNGELETLFTVFHGCPKTRAQIRQCLKR